MTIQQLKLFVAVTKYMNFSIAAFESDISQSSLSKHIKSLENELYVTLINRSTRKIKINPAGMELLPHAKSIIEEYEKLLASQKKYSLHKRTIRINSIPIMNQYKITDMIAGFEKKYTDVEMVIKEMDTRLIVRALENMETDIAILRTGLLQSNNYLYNPLMDDELVLVVHKTHHLADRETIKLKEAVHENFIFMNADTRIYDFCITECSKAGFIPQIQYSDIRLDTIHEFIKKTVGVSLLMEKVAEYFADPDLRIIHLEEKPVLSLALVVRKEYLTPITEEFIQYSLESYLHNKI